MLEGDFRVNMYRKRITNTQAENESVPRNVPQDVPQYQLDEQILEALQKDNKISTEKLAIMLGTSSKTIKHHIKKMDNIS